MSDMLDYQQGETVFVECVPRTAEIYEPVTVGVVLRTQEAPYPAVLVQFTVDVMYWIDPRFIHRADSRKATQ